jgi:hypothetical protein
MSIPLNPSGMPKGTGSLQVRRRTWWMIFRDAQGRIIQENTNTTHKTEARRVLAKAALATLREIVAELEHIAHEGQSKSHQGEGPERSRGRAALSRGARHTDTNRTKTQKGEKRK